MSKLKLDLKLYNASGALHKTFPAGDLVSEVAYHIAQHNVSLVGRITVVYGILNHTFDVDTVRDPIGHATINATIIEQYLKQQLLLGNVTPTPIDYTTWEVNRSVNLLSASTPRVFLAPSTVLDIAVHIGNQPMHTQFWIDGTQVNIDNTRYSTSTEWEESQAAILLRDFPHLFTQKVPGSGFAAWLPIPGTTAITYGLNRTTMPSTTTWGLSITDTIKAPCSSHDFVNMSFTGIRMVCKHCDTEQS